MMDDVAINAGVAVQSDGDTANTNGVIPSTATVLVNSVGVSVDANRTGSTLAQVAATGGDRSDGNNASFVKVCVNPDAVYRAKLSGGATEDTALTVITQDAADTTGLAPGATVQDLVVVWGYKGANVGHHRYTDAADSVEMAFPNDIAVGDEFLEAFGGYIGSVTLQPDLTSAFTQVNATAAAGGNDLFVVFDLELRDESDDGRNNSFYLLVIQDHAFGNPGVVA
jgi:hypothetical protein